MELNRKNLFKAFNRGYKEGKFKTTGRIFFNKFMLALDDCISRKKGGIYDKNQHSYFDSFFYQIAHTTAMSLKGTEKPAALSSICTEIFMTEFEDEIKKMFIEFMGKENMGIFERALKKEHSPACNFDSYFKRERKRKSEPTQLINHAFGWLNYRGLGVDWRELHHQWYRMLVNAMGR